MAQVYSIEISGDKMFGIPKHNPLMFRLKIMTVSTYNIMLLFTVAIIMLIVIKTHYFLKWSFKYKGHF